MKAIAVCIESTDGPIVIYFEPALTPAMYADLWEILSGPCSLKEIEAVVQGLAEDWSRQVSTRTGEAYIGN